MYCKLVYHVWKLKKNAKLKKNDREGSLEFNTVTVMYDH